MGKVLVLSGGSYKGCFQYGVLSKTDLSQYQAVFGTSVGALNGLMVAQKNGLNTIGRIWDLVIYDGIKFHRGTWRNYLGLLSGRLGIYTNLLPDILTKNLGIIEKDLYVTVVDETWGDLYHILVSGGPENYYTQWATNKPRLGVVKEYAANIIAASTCIPGAFSPINIGDMQLFDGGVKDITPLNRAIDYAKANGLSDIDIVLCTPLNPGPKKKTSHNIVEVLLRTSDLTYGEIYKNDISSMLYYNDLVDSANAVVLQGKIKINFRLVQPDFNILDNGLSPTKAELIRGMEHGQEKARLLK